MPIKRPLFIGLLFIASQVDATIEWGEQQEPQQPNQAWEKRKAAVIQEEQQEMKNNLEFNQAQEEKFETETPELDGDFYKEGEFDEQTEPEYIEPIPRLIEY